MNINTETETVIKKILPYLSRRGYDISKDLDFETAVTTTDRYSKGYVDILVTLGKKQASFLIEAKRIGKNLTAKDRDQAISYARSKEVKVPFVVVTNGQDIQCYNAKNKARILWDGKRSDKIPSKEQLKKVLSCLRTKPEETIISISDDESLPYRHGLPLRQLNALFAKGHNTIRKIEKDEEFAFADFSKLLFLKLLEEKSDIEDSFTLPYTYKFYELAEYPPKNADQAKNAILSMKKEIAKETYGDVLKDDIHLENPKTFLSLVKDLASVSFCDCSLDSKGAAFEYYVRATLKGKKLGQYFTPRELIKVMTLLIGEDKIINAVLSNNTIKVLDPACGTGGFLVFLMQDSIQKLGKKYKSREITYETFSKGVKTVKEDVFFGSDANKGVAAAAKMNMIIAGDGHTNILHEDSLSEQSQNWNVKNPDIDIIMTNPPFGTSENDSLTKEDKKQYTISTAKGQYLFLQKMISCVKNRGEICTVIDEGVLNTGTGKELRESILKNCYVKAVVSLPIETFKPNKINVKSSLLYLEKRNFPDDELEDNYPITFCKIDSLGYLGSGEPIRGFDKNRFYAEIKTEILDKAMGNRRMGYQWKACDIMSKRITEDPNYRLDYKYWDADVCEKISELKNKHCPTIKEINTITTARGKSPASDSYVDEKDGYALVVKAGSNISKFGELVIDENSDWIEKSLFDELQSNTIALKPGDVLLASTGDGTLGKSCVFNQEIPAIADSHVTIIRVDQEKLNPYYLADYLRYGLGAKQITRLYSGSTGLVELTPEQVDTIVVDIQEGDLNKQVEYSDNIRNQEKEYMSILKKAEAVLEAAKNTFDAHD